MVGRRARAEFLGRKRDRFQELRNKSATSENTFDEIDADYQTAKQDLREAEYNLELNRLDTVRAEEVLKQRSILSPLDGIVVERNLWRGEYAYEQAPIVTLAQVDPLNVEVYLPTKFYNAIVVGSDATVQPELQEGGRYRATIEIIDSVFDSRSSTFGVRLLLPNPGNKLPAGLHCKVRFLAK